MFKKASEVKAHQRLSGADRKKLRRSTRERYDLSDDDLDALLNTKLDLTLTKLSSKAVLYAVEGGPPLFFDVDGRGKDILPTVFSLWKLPNLLPAFELKGPEVSRFVLNGADLMLPGVRVSKEEGSALPNFQEGDILSVKVPGNDAPIAVGIAATSRQRAEDSGFRGKALRVVHHYLDSLWESAEGRYTPNPGFRDGVVEADPDWHGPAIGQAEDSAEPQEKATREESGEEGGPGVLQEEIAEAMQGIQVGGKEGSCDPDADVAVVPADMDSLLDSCLLQALRVSVKDRNLPIIGSHLWTNHILPSRPPGSVLDLKKSTFKKLSKFLLTKAQERLISVREDKHSKETILVSVNRLHTAYKAFQPEPPSASPVPVHADSAGEPATGPAGADVALPGIEVVELYRVSPQMAPIFDSVGADRGKFYLAGEVSEVLFQYAGVQGLSSALDPTLVTLNPELCDALFKGSVKKGERYPSAVQKRDLGQLALGQMQAHHGVTRGAQSEVRRGTLQRVQLVVERRSSNKRVTRVTGLEAFLLDPSAVAGELQRKFACSTTTGEVPGRKGQLEVLLQGGASEAVGRHLWEHYGIPKMYIELLDKTKK